MDFQPGERARAAEGRVASWLAAEARAVETIPDLDAAGLRRLLVSAQGALGDLGAEVAARLAVARASPALLMAIEATRLFRDLLDALGPGALPDGEVAALSRGERIGAVALADSAAGPARLRRDSGGWRLTARKPLVTNGPLADWIAVFAESEGREAVCLVSPRDGGVRPGPRLALAGLDGLAVSALAIEDAPLPAPRVLGVLGPGEDRAASGRYRMQADLSAAVAAAGLARSALAAANRHARARGRDGRPPFAHQEVAFKLAEVLALAEAAELLCHRAAWLAETCDPEAGTVVRCAKVFCAESAERAASACVQVMGGEGYRRGSAADRAWRDAKGLALAATTTEVARMEIADALLARASGGAAG